MFDAFMQKEKPQITMIRNANEFGIEVNGTTWPLALFLEQLGFVKDGSGYAIAATQANIDEGRGIWRRNQPCQPR